MFDYLVYKVACAFFVIVLFVIFCLQFGAEYDCAEPILEAGVYEQSAVLPQTC